MNDRRILPLLLVCISLLAGSLALPLRPASAVPHAVTGDEVMAAVNELRRSQGLQPYVVDPGIMAYAQERSDYQALTSRSDHLHSDGMTSLKSHRYVENVAGGDIGYLTAYSVVYEIWNDPVHMKTMIGFDSGWAGAGVASDSTTTYVTLNVLPGGPGARPTLPGGTPGSALALTPIALVPLQTATMKPDGEIIHKVGYGQTLWAIAQAYGVTSARIRELNSMAPDDSAIWAGQWLLIVPSGLVTPTPPAAFPTGTALSSAPGLTPSAIPISPTPSLTPTPIEADTPTPARPDPSPTRRVEIDPFLAGIIGLGTLGLIIVLSSGVRINRRD